MDLQHQVGGKMVIDASDPTACPGFIDAHAHSGLYSLTNLKGKAL
jgi:imidazolonepropionase-like amidohydrolase